MRNLLRPLLVMLLGVALPLGAQEAGVRIIVHARNPVTVLQRDELSQIFLKKVAAWKTGDPVIPVDQVENAQVRQLFSERVLGRDVKAVKGYWQQAIFGGKAFPPVEKASDAAVTAFVAANPNAIGYVSASAVLPTTVRVVKVGD